MATLMHPAFGAELAGPVAALQADYAEPFAPRTHVSDCCCVVRHEYKGKRGSSPRRCRAKRRLWNPLQPAKAAQCCQAHRGQEAAARAWQAARWTRYELDKQEVADTACSAREYEERIRELAERHGV